jgi:putative methyltransferase (TIGR04325 family)
MTNKTPLFSDLCHFVWSFHQKKWTHHGVFPSFKAAADSCQNGRENRTDAIAGSEVRSIQNHGRFDFDPRDYPLLVWLARAFQDSAKLFDLGGSVGVGFYAYKRFISYPQSLRWVVCDLPQVCAAGRRLAVERNADCLDFTEDFAQAADSDILLSCGALQCLETMLDSLLAKLRRKPKHLLLQRVPLGDAPTFYTRVSLDDNALHPYRIQSEQELFQSLSAEGYKQVDHWRDSRVCKIPFHPRLTVNGYHGAYFKL